ncbi:MAG: alpha-E domain-containing protein, partial [Pseudomonadota bacterium]
RSASAYHAFRRRHSYNPHAEEAAAFLIFDEDFPRSVACALGEGFTCLDELERDYGAEATAPVRESRQRLAELLSARPEKLCDKPLHRYLDQVQVEINAFSNDLAARYFAPVTAPAMAQQQ